MKSRNKDMFNDDTALVFTLFCGCVGFFLVFGAAWGGRLITIDVIVTLVSLSGLLLCRTMASKYPYRWFLLGILYVLPFVGFTWCVSPVEIKVAHFLRTICVLVTLTALTGSYWVKYYLECNKGPTLKRLKGASSRLPAVKPGTSVLNNLIIGVRS